MDLAQILRELWRLRRAVAVIAAIALFVAISVVYKVSPSGLESKSLEFGAASTQILVDSQTSTLHSLNDQYDLLADRAMVFGHLMTSNPVLEVIAADAGIPREAIVAQGPTPQYVTRAAKEPTAEIRGNDLRGELRIHRVQFEVRPELPVIDVYTQAPDGESAVRLANATASGFEKYLQRLEDDARPANQVAVRQLGRASGGTVNQGASMVGAFLAFVVVFFIGCMVLLVVGNVRRNWRREAADDALAPTAPLFAADGDGLSLADDPPAPLATAGGRSARSGRRVP
jgi:hypothetical protein